MKKSIRTIISAALILALVLTMAACGSDAGAVKKEVNKGTGKYAGKTVILHSNDVHGAIEGYALMKAAKDMVETEGGTVILADDGDFTNGNVYVSISKGESAVTLMDLVGYDVVAMGNHEFDFGFDTLKGNLSKGSFRTVCSNVFKDGKTIFDSNVIFKVGSLKIGFFGILTPETQTKVNPGMIQGLSFTEGEDLYAAAKTQVEALKKCDIVICLSHLGVDGETSGRRSMDLYANVPGIDFIIDGHSHTVMTKGEAGEPIQSTGTGFANIGIIVIDNKTKKIESNDLIEAAALTPDPDVLATAKNVIGTVDQEFGSKFGESKVALDGEKAHVRTSETNLGDLICDAMIWSVTNETELKVDADHVVAVTNGGGIRASVAAGGISRSDIKNVLPFGNTLAVDYVTGAELLEALEASTFCTPDAVGGFPHIGGMKIKIDTSADYDAGAEYPDSTYAAPKSIKRVTVLEVNGKAFDPAATYAVVTNNFCAAGGDTYYSFKRSYDAGNGFDTSIPMDEAVVHYIIGALKCEIGSEYAEPAGRIEIIIPQDPEKNAN